MTTEAVLEMMNGAGAVYLGTVSGGAPRIRALVNLRREDLYPGPAAFCCEQGFTSYFSTSMASGKVADIRANPSAAAYYSDPDRTRGVELRGRVEILTDPEIRKALWDEQWRIYWPAGMDDPDYVVLRLVPERAAGWWGTVPFELELNGA